MKLKYLSGDLIWWHEGRTGSSSGAWVRWSVEVAQYERMNEPKHFIVKLRPELETNRFES